MSKQTWVKSYFTFLVVIVFIVIWKSSSASSESPLEFPKDRLTDTLYVTSHRAPEYLLEETLSIPAQDIFAPEINGDIKTHFASYRDNNFEIYRYGAGTDTRLTNHTSSDTMPRADSTGTHIAFVSNRSGKQEIFLMDQNGSNIVQLTANTQGDNTAPTWSPDGTRLAFQSNRDGQWEIYTMNVDGSNQTRLTFDAEYDAEPAWEPDGRRIAFVSRRTGGYRIYVMTTDGGNLVQLSNQAYSANPTWRSNSDMIAYDADNDGDGWQELMVMNADGSNQHQLYKAATNTAGYYPEVWAGSWAMSGNAIYITQITWILYENNWYWTTAAILYINPNTSYVNSMFLPTNREFYPDNITLDNQVMSGQLDPLPAFSPANFNLYTEANILNTPYVPKVELQYRDGLDGTWTYLATNYARYNIPFHGTGGHTYYFRMRCYDDLGKYSPWPDTYDQVTTIENLPPSSYLDPLPNTLVDDTLISWNGVDQGGSGVKDFDIQIRDNTMGGNWVDWLTATAVTSSRFGGVGILGHNYSMRVRATDKGDVVEAWPLDSEIISFNLVGWQIQGHMENSTGQSVGSAQILGLPNASMTVSDIQSGQIKAFSFEPSQVYTLTASKAGYGQLPPTRFAGKLQGPELFVLPPAVNLIQDGGFESGNLSTAWQISSEISNTSGVSTNRHSGQYAAHLGALINSVSTITVANNAPNQVELDVDAVADAKGNIHAVWVDSQILLHYAKKDPQLGWVDEHILGTPNNFRQILVDSTGRVCILQTNHSYSSSPLITCQDANGAWKNTNLLWESQAEIIAAEFGSNDILRVVLHQADYLSNKLLYLEVAKDGSISTPVEITQFVEPGYRLNINASIQKNGRIYVFWFFEDLNREFSLFFAERGTNGQWTSPVQLPYSGEEVGAAITGDEAGSIHMVWEQILNGSPRIVYLGRDKNGKWTSIYTLGPGNTWPYTFTSPSMLLDTEGNLHVALVMDDMVTYLWRSSQGGWNPVEYPTPVAQSSQYAFPSLDVDSNRNIHLSWMAGLDYDYLDIYYAVRRQGMGWGEAINVTNVNKGLKYSNLVLDKQGYPHFLWKAYEVADIHESGPSLAAQSGISSISQSITLPISMTTPILSFLYQFSGSAQFGDALYSVAVDDAITNTVIFTSSTGTQGWEHSKLDLSVWAGKTITVTFALAQQPGFSSAWVDLDEVSVGSSEADLYVQALNNSQIALPGGFMNYVLDLGNLGWTDSVSTTLKITLSNGLIFYSASITPTQILALGSRVVWDLGSLTHTGGAQQITIKAIIPPGTKLGSWVFADINITSKTPEIEIQNNSLHIQGFVGHALYLPVLARR